MKQFIIRNIINGHPFASTLILYSSLIIALALGFTEAYVIGEIGQVPMMVYFYPFPFLLMFLLWMDAVHDELMSKIDFEPQLNTKRFKRLMSIAVWTLTILSIQILFLKPILSLDFNNLPIWILVPLIVIYAVELVFMLISFYAFYNASHYIGKLMLVVDSQTPFDNNNHRHYQVVGHIWPFRYIKVQKRLKEILNRDLPDVKFQQSL